MNKDNIPQFYYIHKPNGSSPSLKYKGVEPTGPLPESIDFALIENKEPNTFKAIFFGDPQPRSIEQINYIAHDIIPELIGTEAKFGVTLGDIMFDDLDLFKESNANLALIGIPWYNVVGNHDINFDSKDDAGSDETFHRFLDQIIIALTMDQYILLCWMMWNGLGKKEPTEEVWMMIN